MGPGPIGNWRCPPLPGDEAHYTLGQALPQQAALHTEHSRVRLTARGVMEPAALLRLGGLLALEPIADERTGSRQKVNSQSRAPYRDLGRTSNARRVAPGRTLA